MDNQKIKELLKEQFQVPLIKTKEEVESRLSILKQIDSSQLPFYVKWQTNSLIDNEPDINQIYKMRIKNGRLEVDRIIFEDKGKMSFDVNNHAIVLNKDHSVATEEEWADAMFKFMDYLSDK